MEGIKDMKKKAVMILMALVVMTSGVTACGRSKDSKNDAVLNEEVANENGAEGNKENGSSMSSTKNEEGKTTITVNAMDGSDGVYEFLTSSYQSFVPEYRYMNTYVNYNMNTGDLEIRTLVSDEYQGNYGPQLEATGVELETLSRKINLGTGEKDTGDTAKSRLDSIFKSGLFNAKELADGRVALDLQFMRSMTMVTFITTLVDNTDDLYSKHLEELDEALKDYSITSNVALQYLGNAGTRKDLTNREANEAVLKYLEGLIDVSICYNMYEDTGTIGITQEEQFKAAAEKLEELKQDFTYGDIVFKPYIPQVYECDDRLSIYNDSADIEAWKSGKGLEIETLETHVDETGLEAGKQIAVYRQGGQFTYAVEFKRVNEREEKADWEAEVNSQSMVYIDGAYNLISLNGAPMNSLMDIEKGDSAWVLIQSDSKVERIELEKAVFSNSGFGAYSVGINGCKADYEISDGLMKIKLVDGLKSCEAYDKVDMLVIITDTSYGKGKEQISDIWYVEPLSDGEYPDLNVYDNMHEYELIPVPVKLRSEEELNRYNTPTQTVASSSENMEETTGESKTESVEEASGETSGKSETLGENDN